ncbi:MULTISPECIES: DNA polymerase IV [unclassified Paenibacillus]|uniref:DNA polymerase IV n=1 Tax=unclassified Paenibacillus TaxID=185978 RepID=UPI0009D42800|nr:MULTISPECIES: DNA polymerase IV [unclassified Paenibacillus]SLK16433.1 DNA polymerase-4 [Paenibacillus sp. RU5A]SOC74375.1 DNA polymerase-4 [Paenibacillus sp. RU26A]SOC76499.1 DNA polymerase-4 [Paenibacillus sp. RU5M]
MAKQRTIMLIDMQSFYASVEKAKMPEYRNKPLAVAGDPARRSGIILAACPLAKAKGVSTAEPLWQSLQKCPELIIVRPHMQEYIEVSTQIMSIIEEFSDLVEPYSIDEMFIDVTGSLHLFANDPVDLAKQIQDKIFNATGVYARAGIGENKIISKLCCDMIAKKVEGGVFHLKKDELHKHIGQKPIRDMWGIGSRMEKHLWKMGIRTIEDLAKTPLTKLRSKWGVNGEVIWRVANGIDSSPVSTDSYSVQKDIGNAMTLPRDYTEAWEIAVVIQDICTEVCRRTRKKGLMGSVVTMSLSGADFDHPTGFSRQVKLPDPTNITVDVCKIAKQLFHQYWDGQPVRRVGVSLSNLSSADTYQLSLFDDQEQKRAIDKVMDDIKDRFGDIAILRASSITSAGQAIDRAAKIGGHYK